MQFSTLDTAIKLAKRESANLAAIDPRLQSFVAGYLVVEIISEFEQRIEAMFALRARKLGDAPNAKIYDLNHAQLQAAIEIHRPYQSRRERTRAVQA